MSFLQKTARGLRKTTIMLILASLMLCIFLANILGKGNRLSDRLQVKQCSSLRRVTFSVRLPEGRRDEIGAMNSVFNQTIEKIEQLIKQVVEMETVNKDIEFTGFAGTDQSAFSFYSVPGYDQLDGAKEGRG